MPRHSGRASLPIVQIAAAPITPAPKKRTWLPNTASAAASAGPGVAAIADRIGVAMPKAMTSPSPIARPTDRPTRWPAPSSAKESEAEIPVAA